MADKFVPFDDAVKELKISADDVKKLMEEGKIRSFMDGGKVKFRRKDLDDLKTSLGITSEEEELTLAPPEQVPPVQRLETEGEAPPPPPGAPSAEEEFTIEPLEEGPQTFATPASAAAAAAAAKAEAASGAKGGEEVKSLSEFEITSEVEEKGEEVGEEEAELLSVQAGLRSFEEPAEANVGMSVLLIVSIVLVAFTAIALISFRV